jgi:hypothetical protein
MPTPTTLIVFTTLFFLQARRCRVCGVTCSTRDRTGSTPHLSWRWRYGKPRILRAHRCSLVILRLTQNPPSICWSLQSPLCVAPAQDGHDADQFSQFFWCDTLLGPKSLQARAPVPAPLPRISLPRQQQRCSREHREHQLYSLAQPVRTTASIVLIGLAIAIAGSASGSMSGMPRHSATARCGHCLRREPYHVSDLRTRERPSIHPILHFVGLGWL